MSQNMLFREMPFDPGLYGTLSPQNHLLSLIHIPTDTFRGKITSYNTYEFRLSKHLHRTME